ncbi:MAG TPA: recombinase family protein [Tepidimicrobium sp.]|nr:recombinase family protein [Tepidimicrobium sp.]
MDKICIYLRKSRADEEAEKHGEGETLNKHRQILLKVAREKELDIIKIREEVVSGESLIHRPEMLKLLKEVERGMYDAVLVMDIDRLGRGNMQEQGLILETFKKAKTKIITPMKIYDLQDEFDEEYSEFEAFMARKELKIINRRLQRGRIRSIEEGNYLGPLPPFGYKIINKGKIRTLNPHPKQAPIVQMIFDLYTNHDMGGGKIANKLNELGYKTYTGKSWSNSLVLNIIRNEVYAGKIQWRKTRSRRSSIPGQVKEVKTLPKEKWISVNGHHEPLISRETFDKAQEILKKRSHVPYNTGIINPLAGLIKCHKCDTSMVYRPYANVDAHIVCYNTGCDNKSSKFKFIEERLLKGLEEWLVGYEVEWSNIKDNKHESKIYNTIQLHEQALTRLNKELEELETQKNNLHDLLERGIYDVNIYLKRSQVLAQRISETQANIKNTNNNLNLEQKRFSTQIDIIPKVKNVLKLYPKTDSAKKKNKLLKSVLYYSVYKKNREQRLDEFTLVLYPKLPKIR